MELGLDVIALLAAFAFVAGAIDAIAGGGGLITIPALLAAGVPPVSALATGKLQATFGTASAVLTFYRKGHVDLRRFALPTLGAFTGAALGAYVLSLVDPAFLQGVIPLMLVAMAVYFTFAPRMSDDDRHSYLGPTALGFVAALIGFYDGFFGPGTGSFFTTALVALFGLGLMRAVAHAKLLNLASNLAALIVFIAGGHVLWLVGGVMAVASVAGGQLGAHATMRFGARVARPLLIVMCLALTARLLADPANPFTAWVLGWLG